MSNIGINLESIVSAVDTVVSKNGELVLFSNALEAIQLLRAQGDTLWIICCTDIQGGGKRLGEWFTTETKNPVLFCREEEKRALCTKHRLTVYIDGSLLSLGELPESVTTRLLFRPHRSDIQQYGRLLKKVIQVETWRDIAIQLSQK